MSTAIAPPEISRDLRIQLFGPFEVSVGVRLIPDTAWTLSSARSLVKLLALAPGYRLSKAAIIEQLWPEEDEETQTDDVRETRKAQRLHRALYEARRVLEPTLTSGPQSAYLSWQQNDFLYLHSPGLLWVDITAFETLSTLARRTRNIADYDAALSLYKGELLPEDYSVEWVLGPRGRLEFRYLELLAELADLYLDRQETSSAISTLEKLVEISPTYEPAQRDLMKIYTHLGKRYQAVRHYQQLLTAYLQDGLRPDNETERLYKDIQTNQFLGDQRIQAEHKEKLTAIVPSLSEVVLVERTHTNLSLRDTSFVGRRQEITEIKDLLSTTRLVTLTGAGGSGKSRLAEQVATEIRSRYQDGVWLIELSALVDPELVLQTLASILKISQQAGKNLLETLVDALKAKRMLLVLDNCEHLLSACSDLINHLLHACPYLHILVTSRKALHLSEEEVWLVPPLTFPSPDALPAFEHLMDFDALQLFLERARASQPIFTITPNNAPDIVALCQRLDGIPLAIELVATYMKVATAKLIMDRLNRHMSLLEAKIQGALTRHQTLRVVINSSYYSLSVSEQLLFRRLSIFRGGWTIDAADAICVGDGLTKDNVFLRLVALIDASLVIVEHHGESARYHFLEVIHQYSEERLSQSGEDALIAARHLYWFVQQVEQREPELRGPRQQQWLYWLEMEHDNLRAVLQYAIEHEEIVSGLRLSGALWRFWYARGYLAEGLRWLERLLEKSQPEIPPQVRAKALDGAGWLIYLLANNDRAIPQAFDWHQEALTLSRESGNIRGVAASLNALGMIAQFQGYEGHYERALSWYKESLELSRQTHDAYGMADTLSNLGLLAKDQGQYEQAFSFFYDALASFRVLEDERRITDMLINLSDLEYTRGDYQQVTIYGEEALTRSRNVGDTSSIMSAVQNFGLGFLYQGDYKQALPLLEEALTLSRILGDRWNMASCSHALGLIACYQSEFARARDFAQQGLGLYQAVTYPPGIAETHMLLGRISQAQGDLRHARFSYREAITFYYDAHDTRGFATTLEAFAGLALLQGEFLRTLHLFGAAEALRETIEVMIPPCDLPFYEKYRDEACAAFPEPTWKQHWAAGKNLSWSQLRTEALTNKKQHIPDLIVEQVRNKPRERISRREQQVIELVVQGKKDQEIANALGCSFRTVNTHIRNILSKLQLDKRSQITTWAKEQQQRDRSLD